MYLGRILREFDATPALVPADLDGRHRSRTLVTAPLSSDGRPTPSPVIGWRIWRITSQPDLRRWLLRSVSVTHYWLGPAAWNREPPRREYGYDRYGVLISSGFHLWGEETVAAQYARSWLEVDRAPLVYGACELTGRIIEHVRGYRAQGVVIRSLKILPDPELRYLWHLREAVPEFERLYDCDVEIADASPTAAVPFRAPPPRSRPNRLFGRFRASDRRPSRER